jgi:glycerol-3-phosphate acyltransferase PlsY
LIIAALCICSFLLGSVPTGLIVARARGIDLRKSGSGNIGATNVLRTTGKGAALLTLAGDILKGVVAATAAAHFLSGRPGYEGLVGLCSVLGHDFSIFLGFRGGKGVATSLGVLSIYAPQACLFTTIIWIMTVVLTRYSSLGALVSFGLLPIVMLFVAKEQLPVALCITALLFFQHRGNISRLIRGTEPKVGQGRAA